LAGLTTHGIKIGQDIFASQFSALALAVPGVYSVTQAAPIADTEVEIGKIATAGTITIALGQAF
jgi:phage-related baseplate assembly protein